MSKLQWISELSNKDVEKLIESVDIVLFDIDGVLVQSKTILPGAEEVVAKLRNRGKKVGFVTNNPGYSREVIATRLKPFEAVANEVVNPNWVFISYLKRIKFKKEIYVIGCAVLKNLLKSEGFKILEYNDIQPTPIDLNAKSSELIHKAVEMCTNVGIVYVDFNGNCCHGDILIAKILINHIENVEFLRGGDDDLTRLDDKYDIILSKYYIDGLERWTKRKAISMSKPGKAMTDYVVSKYGIVDRNRILIMGDNVYTDIAFGAESGMKTCLTLSGITKKTEVEKWIYREELKPDFVVESLEDLNNKMKKL